MDEQKIAKKIVSYLEEMPLDPAIEDRLAAARAQALLKAKNKQFLEVETSNTIVVKKKVGNQWLNYGLITGLFLMALTLQNPIKEHFFPHKENVTLASPDFEDFLGTTYQRSQEFQAWDNEMDKLLKD